MSLADPITYSTRRRLLDRDLASVLPHFQGRVLEIGAGRRQRRGRFVPPIARVTSWVHADRDAEQGPDVRADGCALPFAAKTFDTVLCLEVLEYVWQPAAALGEMARVLKPGGTLLLSTPFAHRMDTPDDYWRFTEAALRRLLQEAGFEVVLCARQGGAWAVALGAARLIVSVQADRLRWWLSVLLRPLFSLTAGRDRRASEASAIVAAYPTGYLCVARRSGTPAP